MNVSGLRKALPDGRLVTRAPGYMARIEPGELEQAILRQDDALARTPAARSPGMVGRRHVSDREAAQLAPLLPELDRATAEWVVGGKGVRG